jgi:hypothetical protein
MDYHDHSKNGFRVVEIIMMLSKAYRVPFSFRIKASSPMGKLPQGMSTASIITFAFRGDDKVTYFQ